MKWFDDVKKYYIFKALIKRFALPVIVLYMVDSGVTLAQIGFIIAASSLVLLLLEIPSGAIADSIGHKRALILATLGQGLSMALFLGGSLWWIVSATIVYWAAGTLMTGTLEAFFYERLQVLGRAREYKRFTSRGRSFAHAVGIVFMSTAGVLYMIQPWLPFVIGVLQFFIAALVIGSMGKTRDGHVEKFEVALIGKHMKEAVRLMRANKDIFWATVSVAVIIGAFFALIEYDQIRMEELGLTAAVIGFVYAAKRVVGALAPLTLGSIEKVVSDKRGIIGSILLLIIFFVVTAVAQSATIFIVGLLVMAAVALAVRILIDNYTNEHIDTRSRATLLSFMSFSQGLVKAVAIFGLGYVVGFIPLWIAFTGLSLVVFLVTIVVFLPGLRHLK